MRGKYACSECGAEAVDSGMGERSVGLCARCAEAEDWYKAVFVWRDATIDDVPRGARRGVLKIAAAERDNERRAK